MISTPEEYYSHLYAIQSGNPPTLAIIPNREKIYKIDLNTRTIEAPEFLSVKTDHSAETIYFVVDRYYDCVDLASTVCVIQYINAAGKAHIYPVPFYDVQSYSQIADEENSIVSHKMLIPWNIGHDVTVASGVVQYSIKFYRLDNSGKVFDYNLNTAVARGKILHGLDVEELMYEDDKSPDASLFESLWSELQRVEQAQRLNWTDLY